MEGAMIIQKIYTCDFCFETPDDGSYMWEVGDKVMCEPCSELSKEVEEVEE